MRLSLQPRTRPRPQLGGYAGPTAMRAEMAAIGKFVDGLNKDVTAQFIGAGKHGQWVTRWRAFRKEWLAWHDKNRGLVGSYFPGLSGSLVTLAQYRKRAEDFRKQFAAELGGKPVGPGLPPSVAPPSVPGDLWARARPWLIGAGVLYALTLFGPPVAALLRRGDRGGKV